MKPIVEVALAPQPTTCVTPLELLEDFADSVPAWAYLEDESRHYAALRRSPGCVLRTHRRGLTVDLAFAARDAHAPLHLCLIAPDDDGTVLDAPMRAEIAAHFVAAFRTYLNGRVHLVELQTVEADQEALAA